MTPPEPSEPVPYTVLPRGYLFGNRNRDGTFAPKVERVAFGEQVIGELEYSGSRRTSTGRIANVGCGVGKVRAGWFFRHIRHHDDYHAFIGPFKRRALAAAALWEWHQDMKYPPRYRGG